MWCRDEFTTIAIRRETRAKLVKLRRIPSEPFHETIDWLAEKELNA